MMTTPRKTTGKATQRSKATPAQETQHATDEREREFVVTFDLLSERAHAQTCALMMALIDSQAGLLSARDEKSLHAVISKLNATSTTALIERWLYKHHYLPLADSPRVRPGTQPADDRARGAGNGE